MEYVIRLDDGTEISRFVDDAKGEAAMDHTYDDANDHGQHVTLYAVEDDGSESFVIDAWPDSMDHTL